MSDIRMEINWQISIARGWRLESVDCDCWRLTDPAGVVVETSRHMHRILEAEIDWHSDAHWPTLFAELPRGTVLSRPHEGAAPLPPWACCGCHSEGLLRVCQPALTAGEAVCKAWLAFQFAKVIAGAADKIPGFSRTMAPGKFTVH